MPRVSAGIVLFRRRDGRLEVLLAHPGGPVWRRRDEGAWSVPKGEPDDGEDDLLTVARIAESLPPPQQTAEPSGMERTARVNRNAFLLPALGIVFALVCGLSLCAFVPAAVLLMSQGR